MLENRDSKNVALKLDLTFQRELAEYLVLLFFVLIEVEQLLRMFILLFILFGADACHAVFLPVVLQRYVEETVVCDGGAAEHAQLGRPLV